MMNTTLRKLKKKEIIAGLRAALEEYANPRNWDGASFRPIKDVSHDHCSGFYCMHGNIARQALRGYSETTTIVEDVKI